MYFFLCGLCFACPCLPPLAVCPVCISGVFSTSAAQQKMASMEQQHGHYRPPSEESLSPTHPGQQPSNPYAKGGQQRVVTLAQHISVSPPPSVTKSPFRRDRASMSRSRTVHPLAF